MVTDSFTEGLSHDKRLISPVAPDNYGDRFIQFIEGITKSPEEAARETQDVPQGTSIPHTNSNFSHFSNPERGVSSLDSTQSRRRSGSAPMHRTTTTNAVIQRNENEALKRNEDTEPRTLTTVRSPSVERSGGIQGQTLPVVEELGEASSTGGRSGRSLERSQERDSINEKDCRPLTPSKDGMDERPITPAKDYTPHGNQSSATPPSGGVRKALSRSSLEKELPPIPHVSSPIEIEIDEKELGLGSASITS